MPKMSKVPKVPKIMVSLRSFFFMDKRGLQLEKSEISNKDVSAFFRILI
jgi:hypothetical protein